MIVRKLCLMRAEATDFCLEVVTATHHIQVKGKARRKHLFLRMERKGGDGERERG